MPPRNPTPDILARVALIAVLLLLLASAPGPGPVTAAQEPPVVYRALLTCQDHQFMVYGATEHTWWRTAYTGRPPGDPACSAAGICYTLWTQTPVGASWSVPMYQDDGAATRHNLVVEIEDWNNAPLTVAVWPAGGCGILVWLPVVTRCQP